jgi:hypothetical protein
MSTDRPHDSDPVSVLRELSERPETVGRTTAVGEIEQRAARIKRRTQQRVRIALVAAIALFGIGLSRTVVRSVGETTTVVAAPSPIADSPTFITIGSGTWSPNDGMQSFSGKAGDGGLVRRTSPMTQPLRSVSASFAVQWPLTKDSVHELIVTNAPTPTSRRRDALFAVESFANHRTFGCRLLSDATVVCALYDASDGQAVGGGRVAQWSWFERAGSTVVGAAPNGSIAGCSPKQPICELIIRVTFSKDAFDVTLNKSSVLKVTAIPRSVKMPTGTVYTFAGVTARTGPVETSIKQFAK